MTDLCKSSAVAKYEGHLVSSDGTIQIRCTRTDILFTFRADLNRELTHAPFSREHCASVMVTVTWYVYTLLPFFSRFLHHNLQLTLCRANQAIWRLMEPTIRQTLLWICCPIGEVYHGEHFLIQAKTNKAEITNKSVIAKWWLRVLLLRCSNDQFCQTSALPIDFTFRFGSDPLIWKQIHTMTATITRLSLSPQGR